MNRTSNARPNFNLSGTLQRCNSGVRLLLMSFATLSQFFFVGQKTKQQCCGTISATRRLKPSGSLVCDAGDGATNDRAGINSPSLSRF